MFLHAATSQLLMFCFQFYAVTTLWWGSDRSSFCHLKNIWRFGVYKCWNAVSSLAWHHHGTIHLVTWPWAHAHVTLNATRANTQKLGMTCTYVTSLRFTDTPNADIFLSVEYFVYGDGKHFEEKDNASIHTCTQTTLKAGECGSVPHAWMVPKRSLEVKWQMSHLKTPPHTNLSPLMNILASCCCMYPALFLVDPPFERETTNEHLVDLLCLNLQRDRPFFCGKHLCSLLSHSYDLFPVTGWFKWVFVS